MEGIFDTIESILIWGAVVFTIGLVAYLAYLQYLKVKHRRSRRRHRARRAMKQANGPAGQPQPNHTRQS